jgi:hypothetical protein
VFNSLANGGAMLTPGNGIPILTGAPITPFQTVTATTLSPAFNATSTTTSNPAGNGVPTQFGTSTTNILASVAGQEGGFTSQGGVFWNATNSLADNLTQADQMLLPRAAVSVSTGFATFTNNTGSDVFVLPGVLLSVTGTIGSSTGSYAAAGLAVSYTLSMGGESLGTTQLDSVAMAGNTVGAFATTGIQPNGSINPSNPNSAASATLSAKGLLTGTATSFAPSIVDLKNGESIEILGVLTLISDPGSSINVTSGLDPGFSSSNLLPDFGAVAAVAVPEPSTIVLLATGLASAAAWSRLSRRRASPKA